MKIAAMICLAVVCVAPVSWAAEAVPTVNTGRDGRLSYTADAAGNRVPDFSYAGYENGQVEIPDVPARVVVKPVAGDNTGRIQRALDYVAGLTADARGMRGAVLLKNGRFEIAGQLTIAGSGVVLRGSGSTVLVASGTDRRTLIEVRGRDDRQAQAPMAITDKYVPVNSVRFHLAEADALKPGDTVLIRRACTAEWIKALHMDDFGGGLKIGWKPQTREIVWDRTVTAVSGNTITIDAPITTALDSAYGGGTVARYAWAGRISQVGVENLRCESACDPANAKDEDHSWFAITLSNARDGWVRQVTVVHFVGSAVAVWDSCKGITVEDCRSLEPVSENAEERRNTFFTGGQLTLFKDCWSEHGRHDFSVGYCAAGPNAFVQCEAIDALDDSGPIDSWASGVLFDNVRIDGNELNLSNRGIREQFAGWGAANSVLWQCNASIINCYRPPTAQNWAFGCWGQYGGDGAWAKSDTTIKPTSLYFAQLAERCGPKAADRADLMTISTEASSSPQPEVAAELIAASTVPQAQLSDWIDGASRRHPISAAAGGAKRVEELSSPQGAAVKAPAARLAIENGWLVINGKLALGGREEVPWWQGGVRPLDVEKARPSITRFVPGREGPGLTDDLDQMTDAMRQRGQIGIEQHYGLWYDERDDDHERVRRMNGDVWPPFYERPFARSGQGLAWDGLSKYDLTKYNPWYFSRLKQFADLCDAKGLVLVDQQFFQHNIIEAGAHWASCPWRSANNINNMGFPEPPPYAGDKRIFMAEQYYDTTNAVRTAVYRAYVRHCLDNFAGNSNVIVLTSAEFTGPLHFTEWWLDTVAEWEKDTGRQVIVGLSATKDVQDAILAEPARAKIVSLIDIRYWWYQGDGEAYAPPGGQNLAPRQWERVMDHKPSSFDQIYRAVNEYRRKFPDKPVIYSSDGQGNNPWAVLMAGGSLAELAGSVDPRLAAAMAGMKPMDAPAGEWMLGNPGHDYLIYSSSRPGNAALPGDAAGMRRQTIHLGNGREILWLSRE